MCGKLNTNKEQNLGIFFQKLRFEKQSETRKEFQTMEGKSLTQIYEDLTPTVKIVLQIIFGTIIGGVYRILRYNETKNTTTLIVGILCTVTGIGNAIAWVVDLITEIKSNRITVLAD